MEEMLELQIWQLVLAYLFVVVLLGILRYKKINKERQLILATTRMTIQLVGIGYLLAYIFEQDNYLFTILVVLIMMSFAVNNIYQLIEQQINKDLKRVIAYSMFAGGLISIFYFMLLVIGLDPWYEASYFIPIAGMLIGNSMTGISLGVERLVSGIQDSQEKIEAILMLGVSSKEASREVINDAFYAAILPTINSMMGMGIVFLPGMMTGQILAGASPVEAVKYQIAIMMGILGSVTLTVILLVNFGYKTFFNQREQLKN